MAEYLRIIPTLNSTAGLAPKPEELYTGELALNTADGVLYTKNADGMVIRCGVGPTTTSGPTPPQGGCCGDYGTYSGSGDLPGIDAVYAACSGTNLIVRWAQSASQSCATSIAGFIVQQKLPTDSAWQDSIHVGPSGSVAMVPQPVAGTMFRVVVVGVNGETLASEPVPADACGSWSCGSTGCAADSGFADGIIRFTTKSQCDAVCDAIGNRPTATCRTAVGVASGWTATTCFVDAGQLMSFTASGIVIFKAAPDSYGGNTANPDGIIGYTDPFAYSGCNRVYGKHMALIGRIGTSGTPFVIGSSATITATASGVLWLAANDSCSTDNSGTYQVSMTLSNPAP